MPGPLFFIAAAVLGVAGVSEARKSRKDARKAARFQRRSEELVERKKVIEATRQAQIARADVIAQGTNQGLTGSSVLAGAESSIESTAAGNITFLDQISSLNRSSFNAIQKANKHAGNAEAFTGLANIAATAGSAFASKPAGG
jgi:hypothetical protein